MQRRFQKLAQRLHIRFGVVVKDLPIFHHFNRWVAFHVESVGGACILLTIDFDKAQRHPIHFVAAHAVFKGLPDGFGGFAMGTPLREEKVHVRRVGQPRAFKLGVGHILGLDFIQNVALVREQRHAQKTNGGE